MSERTDPLRYGTPDGWSAEEAAATLMRNGYCILDNLYDDEACEKVRSLLDGYWQSAGAPVLAGRGFGIHPVLRKVPEMMEFFAAPAVFETLKVVFGMEARLMRTGARITDENSDTTLVKWHQHYQWNSARLKTRKRVERVLSVAYVDGTTDSAGNLVILPRSLNTPMYLPESRFGDLTGQSVLRLSPGSVALFDSAAWHTARRGERHGRRRLFGGHYQACDLIEPHPDDIVGDCWRLRMIAGNAKLEPAQPS